MTSSIIIPSRNFFGFGCIAELPKELVNLNARKALIVTDVQLVQLGMIQQIAGLLETAGIAYSLYDGVCPNPTKTAVMGGLKELRDQSCDVIISVGGGSAHDCAKAISILATNKVPLEDLIGVDRAEHVGLPLVTVNTTAGTASEITRSYLITDEALGRKMIMKDKYAVARASFNDPSLMMKLPAFITACTGMDALTHAIESYVSPNAFALSRSVAKAAIELIVMHLEEAVQHPDAKAAREAMTYGQFLAGVSFGNVGVGMAHAMSHQIGSYYNLPHGLCNAICLPAVMEFNMRAEEQAYAQIASALQVPAEHQGSQKAAADAAVKAVRALSKRIGTYKTLSSIGVQASDLDMLSQRACEDFAMITNPIQPSPEEVKQVFLQLMY